MIVGFTHKRIDAFGCEEIVTVVAMQLSGCCIVQLGRIRKPPSQGCHLAGQVNARCRNGYW